MLTPAAGLSTSETYQPKTRARAGTLGATVGHQILQSWLHVDRINTFLPVHQVLISMRDHHEYE